MKDLVPGTGMPRISKQKLLNKKDKIQQTTAGSGYKSAREAFTVPQKEFKRRK
jgi:hypothetical protein